MCSYDVVSLFTNVPLDETINIALSKLYQLASPPIIPKSEMKKLLTFATKESHFLFDGRYYDQIDGVGMGSPLGPILANIFMTNFEEKWISNNPCNGPLCWKRYVDDTFTLFRCTKDAISFMHYLNNKHPNIKFTHEMEKDNELSFLDLLISNENNKFKTTIFRKKTFTGLYTKWDSFTPRKYKINLINTLLDRFWKICSNETLFNIETNYLKDLLMKNGYPSGVINYNIRNFINKRKNGTDDATKEGPEKLNITLTLPFIGYQSLILKKRIRNLISKFCGGIQVNVIFRNRFTIGCNFNFKDRLISNDKSCVVYEFTFEECNAKYIGKTVRCLKERIKEHCNALTKDYLHSSIANHLLGTNHNTSFYNNFTIIDSATNNYELTIKEAINIMHKKPTLNENNEFQLSLY